jgi:hypothetical protein
MVEANSSLNGIMSQRRPETATYRPVEFANNNLSQSRIQFDPYFKQVVQQGFDKFTN